MLGKSLGVHVVCETTQNHPFLETVYHDAGRYDLQVELAFLLLHSAAYRQIPGERVTVTDFSPTKDRFFAEGLLSGSDLDLFERVYSQLYAGKPQPETVVFLDAAPDLCMERVRQRLSRDPTRRFEEGLEMGRLQRMRDIYLSRVHELGQRVLRLPISADLSEVDVVDRLLELLDTEASIGD